MTPDQHVPNFVVWNSSDELHAIMQLVALAHFLEKQLLWTVTADNKVHIINLHRNKEIR